MCFDYDGSCEVWKETFPRARKPHVCCECGQTIPKGRKHRSVFSVFEGDAMTSRTCLACEYVRSIIREYEEDEGCEGQEAECPIGGLRDAIREHNEGYGLLDRAWYRDEDLSEIDEDFVAPEAAHLFPDETLAICV